MAVFRLEGSYGSSGKGIGVEGAGAAGVEVEGRWKGTGYMAVEEGDELVSAGWSPAVSLELLCRGPLASTEEAVLSSSFSPAMGA